MRNGIQLNGRHFRTGEPITITTSGDRIRRVEPLPATEFSADLPFIATGLFDLQINGYGGTWFSDTALTPQKVLDVLEPHFGFGVTRMCPTLITNSFESLAAGFRAIHAACESCNWANELVAGCHLEGPHISKVDGPRGAHPLQHVRPADWDEFQRLQEASGNRICLVTLAPECEGAFEFIRHAVAAGVTVSIGHTAANSDQIAAAIDAGATMSTHLGNGAHGTITRHPNYIWDQLGDQNLCAGMISDGVHLPASVMNSITQAKGPLKTIVTCDASGLAGCAPGVYHEPSGDVEVLPDGRIVIAGQQQFLAGSGASTNQCVARLAEQTSFSLAQAIDCAGIVPAQLLGFEPVKLQRGSRADLIQFHPCPGSLEIVSTVSAGEIRFGHVV